jgi:hypothetical protein
MGKNRRPVTSDFKTVINDPRVNAVVLATPMTTNHALVFRLANILTKSFDLFEGGISGGRPKERPRMKVGVLDEMVDLPDQVFHASECSPADCLLSDDVEPDFDLIEPRGIGRGEVDVVPGPGGQPAFDPGMLMGFPEKP